MPISDLLINGVELMLLGMGIVFVFLFVLVFALYGMSRISFYFDNAEPGQPETSPQTPKTPENTALIAVISAAITRYRSTHSQY